MRRAAVLSKIAEGRPPAALRWDEHVDMLPDDDEAAAAAAAAKQAAVEAERLRKEQEEDEREARVLAEIAVQQDIERRAAEAARKEAELRRLEEEEKEKMAAQLEKEREEAAERELYMTMKQARQAAEKEEKKRKDAEAKAAKAAAARRKEYEEMEAARKRTESSAKEVAAAKQQELYCSMQQVREEARKRREREEKDLDKVYAKVEQQAKKAEAEKRKAAQRARELAKKQADTAAVKLEKVLVAGPKKKKGKGGGEAVDLSGSQAGNPSARPSRPPNEEAVLAWWRSEEGPSGVGRDAAGNLLQWFFGPISRTDAEGRLAGKPRGAYLIRLSTRIWGYTLSFVDSDRAKHFLIDAGEGGGYSVFGAQARTHDSLNTLVQFHTSIPVSKSGTLLTEAVGDPAGNAPSLEGLIEDDDGAEA